MVRLTRIYTRGGDRGRTSLGDGKRVSKTNARIAAFGAVDELNATLGVVRRQPGLKRRDDALLRRIQNDLFDVGADLCVPGKRSEKTGERLRVLPHQVQGLENEIDLRNENLQPLDSFVLPGGSDLSAWLHVARTVCRRAEMEVVRVLETQRSGLPPREPLRYLNRLSDLLFVMARVANRNGREDVKWQPGLSQDGGTRRKGTRSKDA
jgi:cob(I)alamin adenosyltransferase